MPCFEGAHISQAAVLYLTDRIKQPIRKGLWWKVFEDDGRMVLIPKGSGVDFLFVWVPLVAVLRLVPVDSHASLATPLMLILSVMSVCHVLGLLGNIATGPILVYGWTALLWRICQGDVFQLETTGTLPEALGIFAVVCTGTAFIGALRRDFRWTISLTLYGSIAAWLCARRYATGVMDEQTVRTYMDYVYLASMAVAALFTLRLFYKEAMLLRRWPEAILDELKSIVMALAGVLPLVAASSLSGAGALPALLGATAAYAALAVIGRMYSPKGLSCLFLPLMVGVVAWTLTAADTGQLPPSTMTDKLVEICASGPFVFLMSGATAVMDGCTVLLNGPVRSAIFFVLNLANDLPIPSEQMISSEIVQVFCLFAGILAIASLMGIAVSLLEGVRPQLVSSVLEHD